MPHEIPLMVRIVGAVVSGVFAVIGLLVIGSLWFAPFGAFGSPPLFFRLFGSLIAVPFVVIGGAGAFAAITAQPLNSTMPRRLVRRPPPPPASRDRAAPSYDCPNCGAALAGQVDVSPSGDAKCPYCKSWFNVHTRRA